MNRQKYKDVDLITGIQGNDFVQLKYDGIWCRCVVTNSCCGEKKLFQYFSRTNQLKHEELLSTNLPDCVLIGEYLIGTEWSLKENRHKKFVAFDIVEFRNHNLKEEYYIDRLSVLQNISAKLPWNFEVITTYDSKYASRLWVVDTDYEGLVFRKGKDTWAATIQRCKRSFETDMYICGFLEGTGKYEGSLGSLFLSTTPGGESVTKCGGGFSDKQRQEIWDNQSTYMNKCVTVEAKKLFESGALRHPSFKRFHQEK